MYDLTRGILRYRVMLLQHWSHLYAVTDRHKSGSRLTIESKQCVRAPEESQRSVARDPLLRFELDERLAAYSLLVQRLESRHELAMAISAALTNW